MPALFPLYFLLSVFLILACQSNTTDNSQTTTTMEKLFSFDYEAIANKIAERMDLQAGERVMMVGKPGHFEQLIPLIRVNIALAKAQELGVFSVTTETPESWSTEFSKNSKGMNRQELVNYFQDIDVGIMLPGAVPSDLPYAAMQDVLEQGKGRTVHFHWAGAYELDQQDRTVDDVVNACYQKALLETDYTKLKIVQQQFEAAMRGKTIHVTTPLGTDIQFEIGDRPVTRQDGDASAKRAGSAQNLIDREIELPPGAIRVAPIEASVVGKIVFPPSDWAGTMVEGLILNFEAGKISDWKADKGSEAVEAVFEQRGDVARSFREFALGMNPLLAIQQDDTPWIPYYAYGAGLVRLSLGDNTELGGNVSGGFVRWNFFTDATVKVGEDIWVQDGKLLRQVE